VKRSDQDTYHERHDECYRGIVPSITLQASHSIAYQFCPSQIQVNQDPISNIQYPSVRGVGNVYPTKWEMSLDKAEGHPSWILRILTREACKGPGTRNIFESSVSAQSRSYKAGNIDMGLANYGWTHRMKPRSRSGLTRTASTQLPKV
jgi:hypothetical protein